MQKPLATLINIFRYPVKSMGGHSLDSAPLGRWGVPGDRAWSLKDEEKGNIKGGKRFSALMAMQARYINEPNENDRSPDIEITLPDDKTVMSADPDVNAQISSALGSPMSLWPLVKKEQREANGLPSHYFDAFPILLASTGSLDTMREKSEAAGFEINYDIRRFRPNLLIDLPGEFPENAFVGQSLKIGDAILKVEMTCPRCVMTTHGFRDLPKDPNVMRELVNHNNGDLGVYCTITQPGTINLGDEITVVKTASNTAK